MEIITIIILAIIAVAAIIVIKTIIILVEKPEEYVGLTKRQLNIVLLGILVGIFVIMLISTRLT